MPVTDLQSFLPGIGIYLPKGANLAAGTVTANLNVSGPTNNLVTAGHVGLYGAKLAGFNLGAQVKAISGSAASKPATISKALLVAGGAPSARPVTVDFNATYNGERREEFPPR